MRRDLDRSRPRIERLHPDMRKIYATMTIEERLAAAFAATRLVRLRLEAHVSGAHPEWTDERIRQEVARRLLFDAS